MKTGQQHSGQEMALYNAFRITLKIRDAKVAYKRKIEGYITEKNPLQVWHGIQSITNYKANKSHSLPQMLQWQRH